VEEDDVGAGGALRPLFRPGQGDAVGVGRIGGGEEESARLLVAERPQAVDGPEKGELSPPPSGRGGTATGRAPPPPCPAPRGAGPCGPTTAASAGPRAPAGRRRSRW